MVQLEHRPNLRFKKLRNEDRETVTFYGVENEIEFPTTVNTNRLVDPINDARFYCVTDFSLRHGVEFLSQPMTWKWIQKYWHHWVDLLEYIKANGGEGKDSCGIHIHFSRSAINGAGLIKLHKLFNSNKGLMASICGRKENRYCNYSNANSIQHKAARHDMKQTSGEKFSAINTCHIDTIEIRTFKGTNDARKMLKYLTFVKSSVEYCMSEVKLDDVSFQDYFAFVEKHKDEYPEMYAWILCNSTANRMLDTVSSCDPIPVTGSGLSRESLVEECC